MFRIKICGVTRASDARAACAAGADAIGLNFSTVSPRRVSLELAQGIGAAASPGVARVGVFVNSAAASIAEIAERVPLDMIQLHGDEPPEMVGELADWPVIRAFRCREAGLQPVAEYVMACRKLGHPLETVLLDAYAKDRYGGTGQMVDWQMVFDQRDQLTGCRIVLAGGLTADNVRLAITTARPAAVDTASGVEQAPGIKDPALISNFTHEATGAFAALDGTD